MILLWLVDKKGSNGELLDRRGLRQRLLWLELCARLHHCLRRLRGLYGGSCIARHLLEGVDEAQGVQSEHEAHRDDQGEDDGVLFLVVADQVHELLRAGHRRLFDSREVRVRVLEAGRLPLQLRGRR